MSDITPADALRELGDDQAEYAAAAAKRNAEGIRARWINNNPRWIPRLDEERQADVRWLLAEVARLTKVLEAVRAAANGQVPGLKAFDPMQHPDVALRDVLHALDPQCSCGAHPHADYCPLTEESP